MLLGGDYKMIQFPTNVSPQDECWDATVLNTITYTSNADYISFALYRIYDYDTNELAYSTYYVRANHLPFGYNGYTITQAIPANSLTNGKEYYLQMMLCQRTADGESPIYDMPVLGGAIVASSTNNKYIYIANGITNIYSWNFSNEAYRPAVPSEGDSMILKINGESHVINNYKPYATVNGKPCGVIELADAFSFNVTAGMDYEIYSNYSISPTYFFVCKSAPTVQLTHLCYGQRIACSGQYQQAENSMIKYYQLNLYWSNDSGFIDAQTDADPRKLRLIERTEKIYSQNIAYDFFLPYRHDITHPFGTSDYYKITCDVVTQDNYVYQTNITPSSSGGDMFELEEDGGSGADWTKTNNFSLTWDKAKGCVIWTLSGYGIGKVIERTLVRYDLISGEVKALHPNVFTPASEDTLAANTISGYDLTASTHGKYKYLLLGFIEGQIVIPAENPEYSETEVFPIDTIETSENAYYITELNAVRSFDEIWHPNNSGTKKVNFYTGNTWKFVGDIQSTTITNNLDRITHTGYGKYVSSTSTNLNYLSGTLSAMIGYVNCTTKKYIDDIALVTAWRKFITQPKSFLLKTQKGDVLIVNITDSPNTQYQEDSPTIPTTFSFSWAESYDIDDVLIYEESQISEG